MTTLLVDLGNTRVKWATLTGRRISRQRAAAHGGWTRADFRLQLFSGRSPVTRVVVVSVAAKAVERALVAALRQVGAVAPEFVRATRRVGDVRNGYRQVWRLGADRWVALLAARALAPPGWAVCVVDVGTATTIDVLNADGRHLGGAIVPGPALMVRSLLAGTDGIRRRAGDAARGLRATSPAIPRGVASLFARSTAAGLATGAWHASAAVIERAVQQAAVAVKSRGLQLFITGGAANSIRPLLHVYRVKLVPDLVLRGLSVVAAESDRKKRRGSVRVGLRKRPAMPRIR